MFIRLCLYKKNNHGLSTVDLSRQNELDSGPKAIQQIEFIGQLKKLDVDNNAADANVAIPLVRDNLPRLVSNLASNSLKFFYNGICL